MVGETSNPTNQKPYGALNIKTYVHIILDLNELNYDAWPELFETHSRPPQASHSYHSSSPYVLIGNNNRNNSTSSRGNRPNLPRRHGSHNNDQQQRRQPLLRLLKAISMLLPRQHYQLPWQPFTWSYHPFWPGYRPNSSGPQQPRRFSATSSVAP